MFNHSECEELNLEATDAEWRYDPRDWERHQWLWLISGIAASLAVSVTLRAIYLHLRSFTNLVQQTHIIRIMIMVPVYAIDSWLSYRFFRYSVYFDLVRDSYEALVVYEFYALLVSYIGGHERAFQVFYGRLLKLPAPLCCVTVTIRRDLLKFCKLGCLQYAVLRPVVTVIAIVSHSNHTLCPGNFSLKFTYAYIAGINFVSVTIAMYALVMFYILGHQELQPKKPIPKFLTVKFVIFFSFWQSVALSVMAQYGFFEATKYWVRFVQISHQFVLTHGLQSVENISTGIQNFLICIEMLISSVAFSFSFPASDYTALDDLNQPMTTNVFRSFVHIVNPCDILEEVPFVSPVVQLTVDTVGKAAILFRKSSASDRKFKLDDEAVLLRPDGRASGSSTEDDNL